MKRLWTVATLSAVLTALTPVAANAATFLFTGSLSGSQQVPPNDSPATGSYKAILDGEPDNWIFKYEVSFADLTGPLTKAHIHQGSRGQTGPAGPDLENQPLGSTSGTIIGDWSSEEVAANVGAATVFEQLLAGQYYFSFHTNSTVNPDYNRGEVRGQIENPVSVASTPEPASAIGLAVAGSAVLFLRRRQQLAE